MESYVYTLLQNIRKVYQLPQRQSLAYKQLHGDIMRIFIGVRNNTLDRKQAVSLLSQALGRLTQLPSHEGRAEERISGIVSMLKTQNFMPKTILDIGAGTGDIISALRRYYNLNSDNVFAIDQKLPEIIDVTPLTYIDGKIPIIDNSIDLIILFVTLHHIPPDPQSIILSEISRILSSTGYVIIREHDDNGDPDFYTFLDIIHLFWYVAKGETPDPLYLMSRTDIEEKFQQVGLVPVQYHTYPEPNPQRLYHEMFAKGIPVSPKQETKTPSGVPTGNQGKQNTVSYKFADPQAHLLLQSYIDKLRLSPKSYQSLSTLTPSLIREQLQAKYGDILLQDENLLTTQLEVTPEKLKTIGSIDKTWNEIVKEIALILVLESAKYVPNIQGVHYITMSAITTAANSLGW